MTAEYVDFCPGCFATNLDGSCCPTGSDGTGLQLGCDNCGGHHLLHMPKWAADSIRRQASWVGKRYYPNHEDYIAKSDVLRMPLSEAGKKHGDLVHAEAYRELSADDEVTVYMYAGEVVEISFSYPDGRRQLILYRRNWPN